MKVTSVEFVKSVADVSQLPKDNLKEIAFAGRSNVGKSTLINCLLNRKKLAKTSSKPGKTRLLNYFRVNGKFHFVDLPGYGFAHVSKQERAQWQSLIESFIRTSKNLRGVVSIIDMRIGPTVLDSQLLDWFFDLKIPIILVATKADKLSRSQSINKVLKYNKQLSRLLESDIISFSAVKGTGKKELWKAIATLMEAKYES